MYIHIFTFFIMTSQGNPAMDFALSIPDELTYMIFEPNIIAEEIDSLTNDMELSPQQIVGRLKRYMYKYKTNNRLLAKIKEKLNSIIMRNYRRGTQFGFHGGAHPEWVMNAFIYNPVENSRFKLLRMDGNQVTVQMWNQSTRSFDEPIRMGLDAFLRTEIYDRTVHHMRTEAMIGEIYRILPQDDEESNYEQVITEYLEHLMDAFERKPSGNPYSDFFSVPCKQPPPPDEQPPKSSLYKKQQPHKAIYEWVEGADGTWTKKIKEVKEGGYKNLNRKTHHKRHNHNKKKKRTYKRRK